MVGKDGRREIAGSWRGSARDAKRGTILDGTALIDPDQVAAVLIEDTSGRQFVKTPV